MISKPVTKVFQVKKSESFNHHILLKNKKEFFAAKDFFGNNKMKFFTYKLPLERRA